jgi:DNA-binding MurR/RpiR family transcriptional regulator
MFTHKAIAELNALELMVYTYVSKHKNQVMYMTIRELAEAAGVSTTTVLRFCKKMGCDGYSEFRIRFKLYLEQTDAPPVDSGIGEILSFFKSVSNEEFNQLIDQAVQHIAAAERIIFVGISTSGDPYYPVNSDMYKNAVAIMLSVSGETEEILRLASQFSLHHCKIISITNNETSSLARLADFNLSYHVPQHLIGGHHNITTQIPVLYVIETIGKRLGHINSEK